MGKQQEQLVGTLHRCAQKLLALHQLIRAPLPHLQASSIADYARLLQSLIEDLLQAVPKLCVPVTLFRKLENENAIIAASMEQELAQKRQLQAEVRVLEERVGAMEKKEQEWAVERGKLGKMSRELKQKAQSLKKSGEEGLRAALKLGEGGRQSLPRLPQKEKLSLLWLMSPSTTNDALVMHLLDKRSQQ